MEPCALPAAQEEHSLDPAAEYLPVRQSEQTDVAVAPKTEEYFPAKQFEQPTELVDAW